MPTIPATPTSRYRDTRGKILSTIHASFTPSERPSKRGTLTKIICTPRTESHLGRLHSGRLKHKIVRKRYACTNDVKKTAGVPSSSLKTVNLSRVLQTNRDSQFLSATPRCKEIVKGEKPLTEPALAFLKFVFQHRWIEH